MKQIFTTLLFSVMSLMVFGQGSISGTILDTDTNDPLIGATVLIEDTNLGTVTDIDGTFAIAGVSEGEHTITISYVGYSTMTQSVTVGNSNVDLGSLSVSMDGVGLAQVNVIASVAVDRKTPVAVTTLKGDVIEAKVGNQEYPEILKSTPSVYVTKQGGGFGDARINVRGFDQRNVAVMINGIPVNDMENGWVYWSNWAGLSDVTSNLQVQRGLGASKLAVPSVGGSINIITNASEIDEAVKLSLGVGNDGYQKYGLMLSSGQKANGFAATAQFTHTRGNGYVDGTKFSAYSYFLSLSQRLSDKSSLSFTVVGAPQWHHQRDGMSRFDNLDVSVFQEGENGEPDPASGKMGRRFNWNTGTLNGEEFNWRRNFYHKPKAFLNHYLTINDKTDLKTSAYVSLGRGGGTGARGRMNTDNGLIFNSFGGFGEGSHDENGQVRWDDIVAYNQGDEIAEWGSNAEAGTTTSSGDGFIRRASMNSHNWVGVLSTLTSRLNENLTLTAGLDLRYYKGIHYRRLENLLGNSSYVSRSDDNNDANTISTPSEAVFGNFADNSFEDKTNVLNYWNDGIVNWMGAFAQLEYSKDKLTAFASVNGSNQGFKRIDYFNYLDADPERETEFQNFLGGNVKAGANFNIDDKNNIFFNAGYISKQPIFDNVFLNFRNDINEDVENQAITSFEVGYGYRSSSFRANVNAYYTTWGNRQLDFGTENDLQQDLRYNFTVDQVHSGLEIELKYSPVRQLNLRAMASIGNWEYANDFIATGVNIDSLGAAVDDITIYADGLKVGDAAQTTMNLGIDYEIINGLRVYADYFLNDNLYAQFSVDQDRQFQSPGGQVLQLDSYSLIDAGLSYRFDVSRYKATLRFNVNNLLDTWYVSELTTNGASILESQGFVGFGRTWNAGVKFEF